MSSAKLQQPPLSLYVHLPWCEHKCPYCDFNSHPLRQTLPEKDYLNALLIDLKHEREVLESRVLHSIFIGGGTPSLFSPPSIHRLLNEIGQLTECSDRMEVTIEANPGSSDMGRFDGFLGAGVNRLSVGVQSFSDEKLLSLGRLHDAEQAQSAIVTARRAGFKNLNIDLMFGLPGQNEEDALRDLSIGINYKPTHLSLYQLTIEPNTYFATNPPQLPDEKTDWDIRSAIYSIAKAAGYTRYEVSAFSKPGSRCKHNLNIWQFGDYLGIGAGAHGKITTPREVLRYAKEKHPAIYMKKAQAGISLSKSRPISQADLCFEFMLNALRLSEGFQENDFKERTGLSWSTLTKPLTEARRLGLLETAGARIRATDLGYRFLDDLVELFLP
jgi:putative oxygen-independent coproporphyrinogen III oxidase